MSSPETVGETGTQFHLDAGWKYRSKQSATGIRPTNSVDHFFIPVKDAYTSVYCHGLGDMSFNHPMNSSPAYLCDKLTRPIVSIDSQSVATLLERIRRERTKSSPQLPLPPLLSKPPHQNRPSLVLPQENDWNNGAYDLYGESAYSTINFMNQPYTAESLDDNLGTELFPEIYSDVPYHHFLQAGLVSQPTLPVSGLYDWGQLYSLDPPSLNCIGPLRIAPAPRSKVPPSKRRRILSPSPSPSLSPRSPKQSLHREVRASPRLHESQYQPPNVGAYVPFGMPEDVNLDVSRELTFLSPEGRQRWPHAPHPSKYSSDTDWNDHQNLTGTSHIAAYWDQFPVHQLPVNYVPPETTTSIYFQPPNQFAPIPGPHAEPPSEAGSSRNYPVYQSSDYSREICHQKGWCNENVEVKIDQCASRKRQRDDDDDEEERSPPNRPPLKKARLQYETDMNGPNHIYSISEDDQRCKLIRRGGSY
ncbi:hypothetical protein CPB86DRAFT_814269 [Serendipita vermifera]|nr:hypothetical protein CPB86DRAFT_814269 [Serendipita vermifera]